MSLKCLDVSKYQGQIEWEKVVADVVILRAGYRGYLNPVVRKDDYLKQNANGCKKIAHNGLYFFSQAINEAEAKEEAKFCVDIAREYGLACDAGIWFDTEYANGQHNGRADKMNKAQRSAVAKAFCDYCIAQGYVSGIYASTSWFGSMVDPQNYPVWVADYRGYCGYKGENIYGWQYSSKSQESGIKGNCDISHWYQHFATKVSVLSEESVRMTCHATNTDHKMLANLCLALGIAIDEKENDIITSVAVSAGDQLTLIEAASKLGIEWKIYVEPKEPNTYILVSPASAGDRKAIIAYCENLGLKCKEFTAEDIVKIMEGE